jgi:hypothetical protein
LPSTITSIGSNAFNGCKNVTGTLTIPSNVTAINSYSFAGCSGLSGSLTIPSMVTSIGASAFHDCAKITELSVGKNLTNIGDNALKGCNSLAKISVDRIIPPTVYSNTFTGVSVESCFINVPANSMNNYQTANYWSAFILYTESLPSDNYTVTVSIGTGGSVKENNVTLGNGSVLTAAIGSNKTFTITPNAGYAIATVSYADVDVTSQLVNNQFTTPAISANATLNVTFSKAVYRLSIKDASTGSVNLVCDYGATFNLDFTPSVGWKVSTVFYNNVDVTGSLINGIYIVPPITDNSLLNVSFVTDSPNSAPEVINNNVKVYTTTSEIIIEGTSDGETIELYSINGKQIQTQKSQGERVVIPAQRDAVYLVKTSGKTFKVIL